MTLMSAIKTIISVSPNWRKVLNSFAKLKFVAPMAKLAIDSASLDFPANDKTPAAHSLPGQSRGRQD